MASQATELFMAFLESQEIKASLVDDEHNIIRIGFGLKNTQMLIFFQFEAEDNYVHLEGREFAKIPKDQVDKALRICNHLNDSYRWVKFVWDEDSGDMCARCDAVIQLDSCAEETYELMARMASIIDEAYPDIMKSLWA